MRPLVLIILALGIARPAIAQCGDALKAETQVVAEREPIVLASNFSLDQIAELARRSEAPPDTAPLGFYTASVSDEISVGVDHGTDGACLSHISVELHLRLERRRIEIGREVVKQPCLYDIVIEHYRKKAAADDAAFEVYVTSVAAVLRTNPFSGTAGRVDAGMDDTTRTEAAHWVKSVVDQSWQTYHDARVAAQRAVDTADEMRRLSRACGRDA
jgi:hypothetical protein